MPVTIEIARAVKRVDLTLQRGATLGNSDPLNGVIVSGVPAAGEVLTGLSATAADWLPPVGGAGGGHIIADEATPLTARATLSFLGAGVTAADDAGGNRTTVTIPGTPNGSAGGDLLGTYPNPTVKKLNGITIDDTPPEVGYTLIASSTTQAGWSGPTPPPPFLLDTDTATNLTGILRGNGADVDVAVSGTDYEAPGAAAAAQAFSIQRGNHTGTQTMSTISDAGTLATLSAIGSAQITDGAILNADINAGAAIALSKLATDPLARANHTGTQTLATISDAGTAASHAHGEYQPNDSDLSAIAALSTTAFGRALLELLDAAAARTALGLGTLATQNGTIGDYQTTAGTMAFAGFGSITGGLDNARTTATDANTASAIVARDASGNFTAGTITAALTGTASGNLVSGGTLGTPSSGTATNLTGTATGLTAGTVTTNANLTGHVLSTGNAAVLGSFTLANLNTAVSDADVAILGANLFAGHQTFTDNTYDIGAVGATRPRTGYFGTSLSVASNGTVSAPSIVMAGRGTNWGFYSPSSSSLGFTIAGVKLQEFWSDGSLYLYGTVAELQVPSAGLMKWASRARMASPADGVLRISNAADNDFGRLQFGGTTTSFPALKRSTTTLQVRLADDSAFADFSVARLIASNVVRLASYTVSTLPAGTQGDTAFVTDALAPTFLAVLVGGGSVVTTAFYNGTNWVAQ